MGPALLPREPRAAAQARRGARRSRKGRAGDADAGASPTSSSAAEIAALADYVYAPPATPTPRWGEAEIRASRVVHAHAGRAARQAEVRRRSAEPLRRRRDRRPSRHASSTATRFEPHPPLRQRATRCTAGRSSRPTGATCTSPRATAGSRKYDLWNLAHGGRGARRHQHAQRRGVGRRQVRDGGELPAAHAGAARRATSSWSSSSRSRDADGKRTSRVSAVYDAAPRKSFVVALKDIPELWEIELRPEGAADIRRAVHDYQYGRGRVHAGLPERAPHAARRLPRRLLLRRRTTASCIGASRDGAAGARWCNLDVRRKIATRRPAGMPHLGSGITWHGNGRTRAGDAEPQGGRGQRHRHEGLEGGEARSRPPARASSCAATRTRRYAWVDAMMSPRQGHAAR